VSNILLTGSTGFIGSNILRSILKNNRIYIILRNKKENKHKFKGNIKILKFKNYNYNKLKNWEPKKSNINDIVNLIK
tara:strand:- start:1094 stop:1324 length:231 start_codon:yes stop_codon:yes gene_type:complete